MRMIAGRNRRPEFVGWRDWRCRVVDVWKYWTSPRIPIVSGTCALLQCDTSGDTATAGADGGGCALHRGTNPGVLALALGVLRLARRRPRVRSRA